MTLAVGRHPRARPRESGGWMAMRAPRTPRHARRDGGGDERDGDDHRAERVVSLRDPLFALRGELGDLDRLQPVLKDAREHERDHKVGHAEDLRTIASSRASRPQWPE